MALENRCPLWYDTLIDENPNDFFKRNGKTQSTNPRTPRETTKT